jgi:hypothetical protein
VHFLSVRDYQATKIKKRPFMTPNEPVEKLIFTKYAFPVGPVLIVL